MSDKQIKLFDNKIGNDSEVASSMPKWYARTTVVNPAKATTEDGYLNIARGTTYSVGDKLMFIQCNDFATNIANNSGKVYTVSKVVGNRKYTFEEGLPTDDSLFFVILFADNRQLETDKPQAIVPVTVEMIDADRKDPDHKLLNVGLSTPGWYRWQMISRDDRQPMVISELLVAMTLHSPTSTTDPDVGESFTPEQGDGQSDPGIEFDDQGEITLG